jgi:uncharacterized protein YbaR (Trm112 family)
MRQLNPRLMAEVEIMELAQHGVSFVCPVCLTPLQAVPDNWQPGEKLDSLVCPNKHNHFLSYGDEAKSLDAYRDWMENLSVNQYE